MAAASCLKASYRMLQPLKLPLHPKRDGLASWLTECLCLKFYQINVREMDGLQNEMINLPERLAGRWWWWWWRWKRKEEVHDKPILIVNFFFCRAYILGIVRGIDVEKGLLYIHTPVREDHLHNVDLLLKGTADVNVTHLVLSFLMHKCSSRSPLLAPFLTTFLSPFLHSPSPVPSFFFPQCDIKSIHQPYTCIYVQPTGSFGGASRSTRSDLKRRSHKWIINHQFLWRACGMFKKKKKNYVHVLCDLVYFCIRTTARTPQP